MQVGSLYYNQDGIVVRRSVLSDIDKMKNNLRQSDVQEIWASHHHTPESALEYCVKNTIFSCTVENGKPIAIFGINPTSILGNTAVVWMLATDDLEKIQRRFLRHSKHFIAMMQGFYPTLYNWVDTRNTQSIAWLKFCGAKLEEAKPYGEEQLPFHYFVFSKS